MQRFAQLLRGAHARRFQPLGGKEVYMKTKQHFVSAEFTSGETCGEWLSSLSKHCGSGPYASIDDWQMASGPDCIVIVAELSTSNPVDWEEFLADWKDRPT